MLPTEDIIPVTYMGGTGGNFLCHFIVSAKRNIQTIIELSEHGNAHENSIKDIPGSTLGVRQPDDLKINSILSHLNQNEIPNHLISQKPYYTTGHITDLSMINAYFKKSIRITYEYNDMKEIATIFYGKFYHDCGKPFEPKILYKNRLVMILSEFTKLENMPNILFISWKELFKGNIEELITKISTFTDINPDNFSRESLIHWRTKTQYCIDTFSETK